MDKESLYRFFNGTASEAERIQIRNWADASPENMKELLRERKLYTAIVLVGKKESFINQKTRYKKIKITSFEVFFYFKLDTVIIASNLE